MRSEAILKKAAKLWSESTAQRRDAKLAVGKLLHQYILKSLQAQDGMSSWERKREGGAREWFVQNAAQALGTHHNAILLFIHVAMAYELLHDGTPLGDMSYRTVIEFRRFVERESTGNDGMHYGSDGIPPSTQERWRIKHGFAEKAKKLFLAAIVEQKKSSEVRREIAKMLPPSPRDTRSRPRIDSETDSTEMLMAIASTATPKDLAEFLCSLVFKSVNPKETATQLTARLEREFKKGKGKAA